jgi:hypothetical protein
MSLGLPILLFVALTLRPNFFSMNSVVVRITRSAAFSLPTKILQSSAYLTKCSPLDSSFLSSSLSMILESKGLRLPPCGVPTVVASYLSPTITPLTKYFRIKDKTSPSLIVR